MKTEKEMQMNIEEALKTIENNANETLYIYGDWEDCCEIAVTYRNAIKAIGLAYDIHDESIEKILRRIFESELAEEIPTEIEKETLETLLLFLKRTKEKLNKSHFDKAEGDIENLIEYLEDYY